jgi:hypothetical protein
MIMSIGVRRLRTDPPMSLLFIPQMIHDHERTMVEWCRQRETPDSSTRALWQTYHQSHLVASTRNGQSVWWICPFEVFLFILAGDFVCGVKPNDMGSPALLLFRRKAYCGVYYRPWKSIAEAGFEPAKLGSIGKHDNHYTTEGISSSLGKYIPLATLKRDA